MTKPNQTRANQSNPSATTRAATNTYATGHHYPLDLRSNGVNHLTVADQIERRK